MILTPDLLERMWRAFETIGFLIVSAIASAAGTTIVVSAFTASVIGAIAVGAVMVGLQLLLAPSPPKPADGQQTGKQTVPPRMGLLGVNRGGGKYMLNTQKDNIAYDVMAMYGERTCGVRKRFLHDDEVTIDGDGFVNAALDYDPDKDKRYLGRFIRLFSRVGLPTETPYAELVTPLAASDLWTNNHVGHGQASAAMICRAPAADKFQEVYPQSTPQYSDVRDGFLLFDPRDPLHDPEWDPTAQGQESAPGRWNAYPTWDSGTTYSAGSRVLFGGAPYYSRIDGNVGVPPWEVVGVIQTQENHENWCAVHRNPIIQWINVLISRNYGMRHVYDEVVAPRLTELIVEANLCDELVGTKSGDREPRYRSDLLFEFGNDPDKVLAPILAACDGVSMEPGDGTLTMRVGVYRAPGERQTLTDADLFQESFEIGFGIADEQKTNEITWTFVSPSHKYHEVPGDPWRNEDDITESGKLRSKALALISVQSHSQGRRLIKREMLRRQARVRGTIPVKLLRGFECLGHRWLRGQFSFLAELGLSDCILEVQPDPQTDIMRGCVMIPFIVINPNEIDAFDPDTEEGDAPPVSGEAGGNALPVPENLVVTPVTTGATTVFWISFDDENRDDLHYVFRFRLADVGGGIPGPWSPDQRMTDAAADGATVTASTTVLQPGLDYIIEAASVGPRGTRSDWSDPFVMVSAPIILREDGTALLREDGSFFIRES
jgi:hypothetical protein